MSEVAPLISDLAIILIIAGIVTVIFKWLKQPVILGYIVAGIMAGPSVSLVPTVSDPANIKIWADIGVIFLLFAMGLDFSFKKLINVGITAIVATVTIVCGMMFIGYTAGNAMGFSHMSSIFLGGMLSMSSTAIVFKAFNDMGLLQQKFTGIVLGILVIEDLVAVVMMVVLSTLAVGKHFEGKEMLESILKLAAFLIFWSALGILSDTYPAEEDTPFHQQRDFIDNLSGTLPGNGDDCDKSGIFCRIGSLYHGVTAGRDR